ncbi:MAG: hypothetical protein HPY83_08065 [Anaerolineae bacterium]|nr:hypothetical protein [Anaerolineae bacterium]
MPGWEGRWHRRLLLRTLAAVGAIAAEMPPRPARAQAESRVLLPILGQNAVAPHLGYGANLASTANAPYLAQMGFDWGKGFVDVDYLAGGRDWSGADNQLGALVAAGIARVLLRLDASRPPRDNSELTRFGEAVRTLATHVRQTWRPQGLETIAYEVWNEPNLHYFWNGGSPDPTAYTALLRAAHAGIKAADGAALVVSGGLATTGDGGGAGVYGDLAFIRGMYLAGARGHFDALGSHPYGGFSPPEDTLDATYFRRAEEQRQVMLEFEDEGTPIWATEFGWIVRSPECDLGEHEPFEQTEGQQADYLVRAFRYAQRHWPWMGPMFVFNLDFGAVPWYEHCDPVRWYSILYRPNRGDQASPIVARPAYSALAAMPKAPRDW